MKLFILFTVLFFALHSFAVSQLDQKHLTLDRYQIQKIQSPISFEANSLQNSMNFTEKCQPQNNSRLKSLNANIFSEIAIDEVINLGEKVWDIVKEGAPVVTTEINRASALPAGVDCWMELSGWQTPKSQLYRVTYQNLYGMTVVDFKFRVIFSYGADVNGKGRYIANATIMPADLHVTWGYNFNAQVHIPLVFNAGTKEAPIAGMQLEVKWNISTPLNYKEKSEVFYITGDGQLQKLD